MGRLSAGGWIVFAQLRGANPKLGRKLVRWMHFLLCSAMLLRDFFGFSTKLFVISLGIDRTMSDRWCSFVGF